MKTFLAVVLLALGILVGCGRGPTQPETVTVQNPPAAPTPTPGPCRIPKNCQGG